MISSARHKMASKAYPFIELREGPDKFTDKLGNALVTIIFDDEHNSPKVLNQKGLEIPSVTAFWFAWMAFHPESEVHLTNSE